MPNMSVAIDGPAGAGKSSVSKALAKATGFSLLDTGAMYRAVTVAWLSDLSTDPSSTIDAVVTKHQISIALDSGTTKAHLDGVDITDQLRRREVTANVSEVAASATIRKWAVQIQRSLVEGENAQNRGVILEGRDIGTTVLPNASHKFFLTASEEVRAQRRAHEISANPNEILEELRNRDEKDSSRSVSPLRIADDAIVIDASSLGIDDVVQIMLKELA